MCGFLFAFHSNYGSILHQFRDKARYYSKIVIFHTPFCIPRHYGVGRRRNIAVTFRAEKIRMVWLPEGEKILKTCLFVSTESTNVTDEQTHTHTDTAWRLRSRLHSIARQKLCRVVSQREAVESSNVTKKSTVKVTRTHRGHARNAHW